MADLFADSLRDKQDDIYSSLEDGGAPQNVLDAFLDASNLLIKEAIDLHEAGEGPRYPLEEVFQEVRTTFATEWEAGITPVATLAIVDDTISRVNGVLDAMEDCE